jgi:ribonuclease R
VMGGRISGIAKFGVFVKLDETGADGMIPIRNLGREYFHYDADNQTLMGSNTGVVIGLGLRVMVKLVEAAPVTGGLLVELVEIDGKAMPQSNGDARGKSPRRKFGSAKKKAAKTARKVKRTRS